MNTNTHATHPQMLTIRETAKTGILPEYALRGLVKQGKIPGIYVGTKFLVNYDRLCDWLNETAENKNNSTGGTI